MALGLGRQMRDELWGILGRGTTPWDFAIEDAQRIRLNAPSAIVAELADPASEEGNQNWKIRRPVGGGSKAVDLKSEVRQGQFGEKAPQEGDDVDVGLGIRRTEILDTKLVKL